MARVLDRQAFLKLPAGTIYAKGIKWAFDGLEIKGETCGNDWYCIQPAWVDADDSMQAVDRLEKMLAGCRYPMETAEGRDGYFRDDAVFLVLDKDDLLVLQDWVANAIRIAS